MDDKLKATLDKMKAQIEQNRPPPLVERLARLDDEMGAAGFSAAEWHEADEVDSQLQRKDGFVWRRGTQLVVFSGPSLREFWVESASHDALVRVNAGRFRARYSGKTWVEAIRAMSDALSPVAVVVREVLNVAEAGGEG